MNETQRILEIMRVKNLSNIQFSSITGISPATLSQLTSGRSNPTHTIFKKIVSAFPDINPAWIAFGIGEMFVSGADVSGQPPIQVDSSTNVADDNFSFNSDPSFVQPEKPAPAQVIPSHNPVNAASNQAEKHIDAAVQPNMFDKEDCRDDCKNDCKCDQRKENRCIDKIVITVLVILFVFLFL